MRSDKHIALKMRLSGKSYSEISRYLKVPKSTLSAWLSNVVIPEKFRESIDARAHKQSREALIRRNKLQTHLARERASAIRQIASKEIAGLSTEQLFVIGIALYWAEGYKRPIVRYNREATYHPVSLTNSDPKLIKIFLRFLRECCGVKEERLRVGVRIFEHQNEKEILNFWQSITNIPLTQFGKVYRGISISSNRNRPFNRLEHGVVQISVSDTKLYHQLMGYIEKIKQLA